MITQYYYQTLDRSIDSKSFEHCLDTGSDSFVSSRAAAKLLSYPVFIAHAHTLIIPAGLESNEISDCCLRFGLEFGPLGRPFPTIKGKGGIGWTRTLDSDTDRTQGTRKGSSQIMLKGVLASWQDGMRSKSGKFWIISLILVHGP